MEDVSPFATHFARLVWLLIHQPAEQDGQKEELRRSLLQISVQQQAVILRDIAFVASINVEVTDQSLVSLRELAKRMAAHSVRLVEFDAAVPAREVIEVARALASDPTPGDEGASFDEKIVGLFLTAVTLHLGSVGLRAPCDSRCHAESRRTPPDSPHRQSPGGAASTIASSHRSAAVVLATRQRHSGDDANAVHARCGPR